MPAKPEGVYQDGRGGWYVKVTVGRDPLTGRRQQITKRGFPTAAAAGRARPELLGQVDSGRLQVSDVGLTLDRLLDFYLDGLDADGRLSAKTRFDYRRSADDYIRPHLGSKKVKEITLQVIVAWQRALLKSGAVKSGKPLSANTVRLARAPLAGAFKAAVAAGMIAANPMVSAPRPRPQRKIPRHWTPEQAREFLGLMEGDRTWHVWAFLTGSGLRIGELVCLRWSNVDLDGRVVRVVDFVSTLDHDIVPSAGKSRDAVRTIDLDDGLIDVLRQQRAAQAAERLAAPSWLDTGLVFTKPDGGTYHPQYLSKLLGRYSAELGLPRLTAHGLRHTSATFCQWSACKGGGGTVGARRPDAVHQPLQPRHADDAAGGSGQDWRRTLRTTGHVTLTQRAVHWQTVSELSAGEGMSVLEELAREQHARPVLDIEELRADVWSSDEELDEFLVDWRASRDASLS